MLLETCLWKDNELLCRIEKQLLCDIVGYVYFMFLGSDFTCTILFIVAKGKGVIIYCL